jgi:microcystin-dependent protein
MSSPFVAEIRIFACNFAPVGWALCNGQILPISQNTALFSLLGTSYGGDGKSTFALPDFQGSAPMHAGQSTTGTEYFLGQQGGAQFVTLLQSEIPVHAHNFGVVSESVGDNNSPSPNVSLARASGANPYLNTSSNLVPMAPNQISVAGGSLPHNNMQPYLTINFCIALQGVFPARP